MNKYALVLVALLGLTFDACAIPRGGAPNGAAPPSSCPLTFAPADDGCLTSPGGLYQVATLATGGSRQSGQSWATSDHPWGWNQSCVDFACANITAKASMKDPVTQAATSNGCSWDAPDNTMQCTGSGALQIKNFDFSLHNGMLLRIHGTYCSGIEITDNYVLVGTASDSGGGSILRIEDSGCDNDLNIHSNYIDGNGNSGVLSGGVGAYTGIASLIFDLRDPHGGSSTFEFERNACIHVVSKCWSARGDIITDRWNIYNEYDASITWNGTQPGGDGAHGENSQFETGATISHYISMFNMGFQPASIPVCGATNPNPYANCGAQVAFHWISAGSAGTTLTLTDIKYNICLTNRDIATGTHSLTSTCMEPAYDTFGTINFTGNYIDCSGAQFAIASSAGATFTTVNNSGNVNLLNNGTLTMDGGCTGHGP